MMKTIEHTAVGAVRDLLGHVPNVEIASVGYQQEVGLDYRIDGRVCLNHGDVSFALIIEVKSNGAPRFVRSAVYQLESCVAYLHRSEDTDTDLRLIPMVVSPYLSPESRAICTDHSVAYLDLVGNAHLAFGSVYIERTVAYRPKSETRALRSIFSPKAAAILLVMLRNPDRAWRVIDLANNAKASLGHVSNVRKALLEREWIEKQDDGVVLIHPDALLKTWRQNYHRLNGYRISEYTHLHGKQLEDRLLGQLNPYAKHPRAIYSLNSAAQWIAPFGRDGTHTFYADEPGAQLLKERLELTPATIGANVVLCIPTDESLFDDAIEPIPDVFCTSPIITYLDLWSGNERERDAAKHLARESFPWLR